jgi:hypothetical protein
VTLESKNSVVARHSLAVVNHTHQTSSSEFDVNLNSPRSGVNRIFDKLFYNRSWSFNNFTGGDLIG